MRIGLNALYWRPGKMGGTQTYLVELLKGLLDGNAHDEVVVFLGADAAEQLPVRSPRLVIVPCRAAGRSRLSRLVWERFGFDEAVRRSGVDVLHSLGYLAPPVHSVPQVVTLLDLVHYAWPSEIEPIKRMLWSYLLPASLRRATIVLTLSESVRAELGQRFPWALSKTIAVHLGVDPVRFSPGADPPRQPPFILAVASQAPHKNLDGLLRAFSRVRAVRPEVTLRLAGMYTPMSGRLMALADELGLGDSVEFLGRVDDDRLVELYRSATVMAFPSLYEGFGLPTLEAMASGCPVVCGSCAAVCEVAGDAAMVTDVINPERHAAALLAVLDGSTGLAHQLRDRGFARISLFSWAEVARRTRSAYESAVHHA